MDRFKFRLWDNDNEVYDYIDFRDLSRTNETLTTYEEYFYNGYFEHNQDCIEQCTGLKDKNGNLIYEGDIIQNPNKDQYIVEWIVDGYWHIRQIDDEKFGCALASIKTLYDGWEIIGNIHEQKD